MKAVHKKISIILISFFSFIILLLAMLPFIFEAKIKEIAKSELNRMWNAKVDFEDVNVSFLRSFPRVSLQFSDFSFSGVGVFEKDTMIKSDVVDLTLDVKSLFSDNGYDIGKLKFTDSKVKFHFLPDGQFNWTSILKEDTTTTDTTPVSFHFKLKKFEIENADFLYLDEEGDIAVTMKGLNHTLTGDLTADSSMLVTHTTIDSLTFSNDGFEYMTNVNASMDADVNANINAMVFHFSKNEMMLNNLPFSLNGWFSMIKGGISMDFKLNAEKVEFKSLLSLVPVLYSNNFDKINAGGKVSLSGFLKGDFAGDYYPSFDLNLQVADGWFKYPSLQKQLDKINISARLLNRGNTLDETIIDVSRFGLNLGGNPFSAKLYIATPDSDPLIKLDAKGKINLGYIKDIYPLDKDISLSGLINLDLQLAGNMSDYEKNRYEKFTFDGNLALNSLIVKTKNIQNPVEIEKSEMSFNNRYLTLSSIDVKTGKNIISADGKIENFLAYIFENKTLKGNLNVNSEYLNVNDFIKSDTLNISKNKTGKDTVNNTRPILLPANLDFTLKGHFNEIVYDKMRLRNATGVLTLSNSTLSFNDLSVIAFGGNFRLNGFYSTADTLKPVVDMSLALNDVTFKDIFKQVDVIQNFTPLFDKATGKFNTSLSLNALLNNKMMPDLMSLISQGKFNTQSVALKDVPVLEKIALALSRKDLLPMSLKDLGISFEIDKGKLITKPFNFKIKDVGFTLGGITVLDKTIDYKGTVTLPDKLNLGKLSTYNITVGGTFTKPVVKLDLKSKITDIVTETATKAETEINKKVDEAKEKALEEARKQKEKAVLEAKKQADKLIAGADSVGNLLILQAEKQGNELVKKAGNPITKAAAELAARKLTEEARKKAADLKTKAQSEAQKIIQKASDSVSI